MKISIPVQELQDANDPGSGKTVRIEFNSKDITGFVTGMSVDAPLIQLTLKNDAALTIVR